MKNKIYTISIGIFAFLLLNLTSKAQLSGNYTVPGSFASVAAAVNSLNLAGVSGPVTIAISAGYTETVSVGGLSLTATGSNINPITFIKSGAGANPILYAYSGGTAVPNSALQDGIFALIGSDYITVDGIDFTDPNVSNPSTMEFGIGLFKLNAADGCQNNLIRNCVITLNRVNNATGAGPIFEGSKGIQVVNSARGTETTAITVTTSAGANSNNQFYSNLIQNVNYAIVLNGFVDVTPFTNADNGNDIGGLSAVTGNTLINFGGGAGATNQAAGVRTLAQYNLNVSFNTVNNNNGLGVNHPVANRAILVGAAISANSTINSNTLSIKGGGTTSQVSIIENISGATAANNTITINNNLISNNTNALATTGTFYGIWNTASAANLNINNNTFTNNTTNATTGTYYLIYNTGVVTGQNNINNNTLGYSFASVAYSGTFYQLYNSSGAITASVSITSNTFAPVLFTNTGSGTIYFVYNTANSAILNLSNNLWSNLAFNHSGSEYFMYNSSNTQNALSVLSNTINTIARNSTMGTTYLYYAGSSSLPSSIQTFSGNLFSNITATLGGTGTFYGMYNSDGASSPYPQKSVYSNTITNINLSTTGTAYGIYTSYLGDGGLTSGSTIFNNVLDNISTGGTFYGLYNTSTASPNYSVSVFSNTISNLSTSGNSSILYATYVMGGGIGTNFFKNKLYNVTATGTLATVHGIFATTSPSTNIYNNLVGALFTPSTTGANRLNGIFISGGTNINLFYNTVRLNATSTGTDFGSNAVYASTTPSVNLRNNIFINLSTPSGVETAVAYKRSTTSLTTYSSTSNNNIYAGVPTSSNLIFADGTNSVQTLPAFQALVTPRDVFSATENTSFLSLIGTSVDYLHVNPVIPSLAESGAVNISPITDDYDANIRQGNIGYVGTGTAPDIGADEFATVLPACNAVTGGTIAPNNVTKCAGQTQGFTTSGYTTGSGIVYQWQVGTTPGGPYVNVVGGVGANTPSYLTPTLNPGSFYYVLLTTCTVSGSFTLSNEATVVVNPVPSLTVTPQNSNICLPGSPSVNISGAGALSYTWSPITGLNTNTGSIVTSTTTSSIIYTLTGENSFSCTSTITAAVVVSDQPSLNVTASPTLVCPGANSTIQANATSTTYIVSNISYSPVPTPTSGVLTLAAAGVPVTPLSSGTLDDGGWTNISIPFNFNFFGTTYSTIAVSTNGFVYLGSGVPNTFTGYGATPYPSATKARPSIGIIYSDLNLTNVGSLEVYTVGVAPNRKVVVNYTGVQYWSASGTVTAQGIIYETSNDIEVHTTIATGNNPAVEGIQNAAGTGAFWVNGRNGSNYVVSVPDAYRFSPATFSYSWTPSTYLTGTNIPNPIATTVTNNITYSLNVLSNNGCSNTGTVSLAVGVGPTVSISGGTAAVCNGSTVNLTASGADTYSWSTGSTNASVSVSPSVTTVYTVVGTSTALACPNTVVKTVTINPTPVITVSANPTVCLGQSLALIATGATNYTWSTGSTLSIIPVTPTANITYSVVGSFTTGCSSNAIHAVTVHPLPSLSVTASPSNTICIDQSATLIASGISVDAYNWNTGATNPIIVVTPTTNTSYTITGTNNTTGCLNTRTISLVIIPCTGLEEMNTALTGLNVYPNPSNGRFLIQLANKEVKAIDILDVTGRVLVSENSDKDAIQVNIQDLANGIYYARIRSNEITETIKIIKQ